LVLALHGNYIRLEHQMQAFGHQHIMQIKLFNQLGDFGVTLAIS